MTNPVSVFCRFAPVQVSAAKLENNNNNASSIHVAVDGEAPHCSVTAADTSSCAWVQIGCTDVIDPSWSQQEVFKSVAAPVLDPILSRLVAHEQKRGGSSGKNLSSSSSSSSLHHAICSYGQTNAGKTYTQIGPNGAQHLAAEDPQSLGLLPRSLQYLFAHHENQNNNNNNNRNNNNQQQNDHINSTSSSSSSSSSKTVTKAIEVACVEIYNETAQDLVALLRGGEFASSSTYKSTEKMRLLRSLQRARCESLVASLELMKRLLELRKTSATASNDTSSRSHIVFRIILPETGDSITFCDLAGSESLRLTPAQQVLLAQQQQQQESTMTMGNNNNNSSSSFSTSSAVAKNQKQETKNINASLLALKKVVRALRKKSDHVPFKDSMLTAVLEPCFHSAVTSTHNSSSSSSSSSNSNSSFANSNSNPNLSNSSAPCPLQIIVCCSGLERDSSETFATLRFAAEASAIRPVGMLNPLTMNALKTGEQIMHQNQQKQQQQRRGGRQKSSSAPSSRSSSAASSFSSASSSASFGGIQHRPVSQAHNFSTGTKANSRSFSSSSNHQEEQEEEQQEEQEEEYSEQQQYQEEEEEELEQVQVQQEEDEEQIHQQNRNCHKNEDLHGDSMQRVMNALVDENASLRTQIATQRQEIDESSTKAAILMEKSVSLLEKYDLLQQEVFHLRQENASLKNGGSSSNCHHHHANPNFEFQGEEREDEEEVTETATSTSNLLCETPPPPGVKLHQVKIASQSTPTGKIIQQQQHQHQPNFFEKSGGKKKSPTSSSSSTFVLSSRSNNSNFGQQQQQQQHQAQQNHVTFSV